MREAIETSVGRPRKYGGEETETVSVRVPQSLGDYLRTKSTSASAAVWDALIFERSLTEELESALAELRISAALAGSSYDLDRAGTIGRLVRLGLAAEKKSSKK